MKLKQVENEKAIECFLQILQKDPNNSEIHQHLGLAYSNLGNYEDALESWKMCVSINPDNHQTWWNLGQIYEILGNGLDAAEAYDKAAETAIDNPKKVLRYKEWAKNIRKKTDKKE
ncbi:MAG: tetratricopeptide repeat protein [Candidatus Hodarchaeales archaeon]